MSLTANIRRGRAPLLAAGFAFTFLNSAALAQRTETLGAGTVVKAKLDQDLSSKDSRVGDRFSATIVEGQDDAGLPYGTKFEGVIREAVRHSGSQPGVLDMDFTRIIFPNRDSRAVSASLISLDNKSVSRNANGRLVSKGSGDSERWKWVGIGAGAGLLLSTLTKSDSILTTILGAGLGYLYNETQNKKPGDVTLKSGTEFGVKMNRSFAFTPDNYRSYYRSTSVDRYNDPYAGPNSGPYYDDRYRTERPGDRYYDDRYRTDRPADRYYDDPNYDYRDTAQDRYYRTRPDSSTVNGDIIVRVDGRNVRFFNDRPILRNGAVLVPFAVVARAANISYVYDAPTRTISIRGQDTRMNTDQRFATVDGRRVRMGARAELRNGILYVPMEFVGLALDGEAVYDSSRRTVEIRSNTIER